MVFCGAIRGGNRLAWCDGSLLMPSLGGVLLNLTFSACDWGHGVSPGTKLLAARILYRMLESKQVAEDFSFYLAQELADLPDEWVLTDEDVQTILDRQIRLSCGGKGQ